MSASNPPTVGRDLWVVGLLLVATVLSACAQLPALSPSPPPEQGSVPAFSSVPIQVPATSERANPSAIVVYVKDGNIHVGDSATGLTRSIVDDGDATEVSVSDDGQVIAFLRHSVFDQPELWEQFSIWAVDPGGTRLRQLLSAETLRQRLQAGPTDSTGIAEFDWISGTHRLVYSGTRYYAPGQSKPGRATYPLCRPACGPMTARPF